MKAHFPDYVSACKSLVHQVGILLVDCWQHPENLTITTKSDGTPSTSADILAHQHIIKGLKEITPQLPILSEEDEEWSPFEQRSQWPTYWLIDPLDGTRGFISQLEQFSINIALIMNHLPVFGVIYSPVSETIYYAWEGGGAYKQVGQDQAQPIQPAQHKSDIPWRIVIGQYSRGKRLEYLINGACRYQLLHVNGSVKFGWLAEGQADIYPRFGAISEWDTAAGQCILTESGGRVVDLQGQTLQYNRKDSLLNPDFIAVANSEWVDPWLKILNKMETK